MKDSSKVNSISSSKKVIGIHLFLFMITIPSPVTYVLKQKAPHVLYLEQQWLCPRLNSLMERIPLHADFELQG